MLEENAFYYPSADKVAEYLNRIDTMAEESKIQYTANNIEVIEMNILGNTWWMSTRSIFSGCWNRTKSEKLKLNILSMKGIVLA